MRLSSLTILIMSLFVFNMFVTDVSYSQFKEIPQKTQEKLKKGNGLILGFINPKNFTLHHSVNLSYQTIGNQSVSLTSYTATLDYKVMDNMHVSADVTMQYSPYASISSNAAVNKDFQNSLNGISLSRVSFDYQPFKNMYITVDYINNKNNNLYWYNNPLGYWDSRY